MVSGSGQIGMSLTGGGLSVDDYGRLPRLFKITGGSNPYAAQEVYLRESDGAREDYPGYVLSTDMALLWEINGDAAVAADAIVAAFPNAAGNGFWFTTGGGSRQPYAVVERAAGRKKPADCPPSPPPTPPDNGWIGPLYTVRAIEFHREPQVGDPTKTIRYHWRFVPGSEEIENCVRMPIRVHREDYDTEIGFELKAGQTVFIRQSPTEPDFYEIEPFESNNPVVEAFVAGACIECVNVSGVQKLRLRIAKKKLLVPTNGYFYWMPGDTPTQGVRDNTAGQWEPCGGEEDIGVLEERQVDTP